MIRVEGVKLSNTILNELLIAILSYRNYVGSLLNGDLLFKGFKGTIEGPKLKSIATK